MTPVKVGLSSFAINAYWDLVLADELGFFKENNLDVEFAEIASPGTLTSATASGSLQFAAIAPEALIFAIDRGVPLTVITGEGYANFDLVTDADIDSYDELKGKKIAINDPNSGNTVQLLQLLEANGLSADDVELVQSGSSSDRLASLQSGAVVGAMLADPVSLVARADDKLKPLGNTLELTDMNPYPLNWIAANDDVAENDRPLVLGFLAALEKTRAWMYDSANEAEAVEIVARVSQLDPALAEQSFKGLIENKTMSPDITVDDESVEILFETVNELDKPKDRSKSDYVDESFVEELN